MKLLETKFIHLRPCIYKHLVRFHSVSGSFAHNNPFCVPSVKLGFCGPLSGKDYNASYVLQIIFQFVSVVSVFRMNRL